MDCLPHHSAAHSSLTLALKQSLTQECGFNHTAHSASKDVQTALASRGLSISAWASDLELQVKVLAQAQQPIVILALL